MTLKDYRKTKLLTQQDLAKALQVRQSTISYWERGVFIPNQPTMQKLAEVLNVDLVTILACFYGKPKEVEI